MNYFPNVSEVAILLCHSGKTAIASINTVSFHPTLDKLLTSVNFTFIYYIGSNESINTNVFLVSLAKRRLRN